MRQLVLVLAVVAASLVATPAFAQRGEASVLVGWTFSDGVTGARFVGKLWDDARPSSEAAKKAREAPVLLPATDGR